MQRPPVCAPFALARVLAGAAAAWVLCGTALGTPGDADFLALREAVQRGQWSRVQELAPGLRDHPLQPWSESWQLRRRLDELPRAEVRQFLDRHGRDLVGQRLRADWLRALARARDWDNFEREWSALSDPDTELQCLRQQALAQRDTGSLGSQRSRWFTGEELPAACNGLFEAMFAAGVLGEADARARARLAFATGDATLGRQLMARTRDWGPADQRRLDRALRDPARLLGEQTAVSTSHGEREVVLFALGRVAASLPDTAAAAWQRLAPLVPREDQAHGWHLIGSAAARRHHPQALEWFRRAGALPADGTRLEWRARAALRAHAWDDLLASVDAMEPALRDRPVWRYWRARSLRRLGREAEAIPLLVALSAEHNFHAMLATEELGTMAGPAPLAYRPSEEDVRNAARHPGIARALAWYRLGLRYEGNLEWIWSVREMDDPTLLGAAELARREGWYERTIATAERTRHLMNMELRYPTPFQEVLRARAREFDVDEAWLYGLVRQESRFNAAARSSAGAAGLMQIMPATARWVARKLGLRDWRPAVDNVPEANVNFGTFYLKHVLERLNGSPVLASAAYNAGPGRAEDWRASVPMEGAVYIDTIPFTETRDYVRKVMANAVQYARLLGRPLDSLTARIGTVPPRPGGAAAARDDRD